MAIDQSDFFTETNYQHAVANFYGYLLLKQIGYSDTKISSEMRISISEIEQLKNMFE